MWHTFYSPPVAVRVIAGVTAGSLAVLALIKARAIGAAWNSAHAWFWGWVSRNVSPHQGQTSTKIDLRLVTGSDLHSTWSIGIHPLAKKPMMILVSEVSFAHVADVSVILKRGYLRGTKEVVPMSEIVVEGPYDESASVCLCLSPVKAKPGENLVGKVVFVDQFNRKHVSEKITFRPNTLPSQFIANMLQETPNCFFCERPVQQADQAKEAQMTAHTTCIWQ